MSNKWKLALLASCFVAIAGAPASAQDEWTPESMLFVISHSVGGGQTPATHSLGKYWGELLGTENTYENKAGGSQRIGYEYFIGLDAAKECEAVLSSNPSNAIVMYLQQKPDWKWDDSVVPLGVMAEMPGYWFVNANSDIENLDDLIAQAKSRTLTVAMANYASSDNLQLNQVTKQTGASFEVVPSGGAGTAMATVLGGHVDFGVNKLDSLLTAGDLVRVIAALVPENPVPAMTQGAPALDEALGIETIRNSSTRSILAHKDCQTNYPERFAKLQETLEEAKADPEYQAEAEQSGIPTDLIPEGGSEIISETNAGYEAAFDEFGSVLSEN